MPYPAPAFETILYYYIQDGQLVNTMVLWSKAAMCGIDMNYYGLWYSNLIRRNTFLGSAWAADVDHIISDQPRGGNQIVTIFNIQTIPALRTMKDIIGYTFNILAQV